MRGEVRRGYFVRGLPGVQFALPEAVEQLRRWNGEGQTEDEERRHWCWPMPATGADLRTSPGLGPAARTPACPRSVTPTALRACHLTTWYCSPRRAGAALRARRRPLDHSAPRQREATIREPCGCAWRTWCARAACAPGRDGCWCAPGTASPLSAARGNPCWRCSASAARPPPWCGTGSR